MEKSLEAFFEGAKGEGVIKANEYSPISLAYIGDSVFDLLVKTVLVNKSNKQSDKYHREASKVVSANAQAEYMAKLEAELTEDELAIYKRGRNAKTHTTAKNATVATYRKATGFEAVIGYLYLDGQYTRLFEIVSRCLELKEV